MAGLAVKPHRLHLLDLFTEAALSVARDMRRSVLTALGIVLGAAGYVCTLGLTSTLSYQVSNAFDIRRATEVRVHAASNGNRSDQWYSNEAINRLESLNGVVAAGRRLSRNEQPVRRFVDFGSDSAQFQVTGVNPGALHVIAPHLIVGRLFDSYHDTAKAPVALLPQAVADRLGIGRVQVAIFIGDRAYMVVGIFDDVERRPESLQSILIPFSLAGSYSGPAEYDILIETLAGAANLIADQAPFALSPEAPRSLQTIAPPDPRTLRREVESSVKTSSVIVSLIILAIGGVGIANTSTAAIAARTSEIGLRRSVGAGSGDVFVQLLIETTLLGAIGGAIGALVGMLATVTVSIANGWVPIVDVPGGIAAASIATGAGLLAGVLPAIRAMRIQPVAALQR